ncbi:MAG TPA: hypothetical protein VG125_26595 [Pirellulales bacterium]|nr:hypothetical protein [Pirellulales bacterium]
MTLDETPKALAMRAANLSQVVVRCGRILADSSLVMRACLLSGVGHAVALITMALVIGGGTGYEFARPVPFLTVSASDELATLEPQPLVQSSTEEFDRLIQPAQDEQEGAIGEESPAEDNGTIAEWLSRSMASPAALASFTHGAGQPGAFEAEPHLATEVEDKATEAERRASRTASFYGVEADGRNFVYVVDISGSMSGSRFRRARTELRQSIENLDPAQSFYVILFNNGPTFMPSVGMAAPDPANVRLVENWLKKVECSGNTNPLPALLAALAMQPDAVYLLSDGKFDPTLAQTVSQLQGLRRIPIHTIGFASRKGESMLRAISQVSGGTYQFVR